MKYLSLLLLPLLVACQENYRYPCQDPDNWDKPMCQKPICDVRRECPEHIFKGQRDPRLGPPSESTTTAAPKIAAAPTPPQGANCK